MTKRSHITKTKKPKTGSERLASFRARGRILDRPIPSPAIIRERTTLEKDTAKWLRKIFPGIYRQPFGMVHHEIIAGADYVIDHGGRYEVIAPRGSGKSYVLSGCILKAIVQRRKRFPVLIPWAAAGLKKALSFWKKALCFNQEFARLYPEWCFPFVASRGTSQRCATYTDAQGEPYGAQLLISEGMIVFPDSAAVVAGCTLNGNPLGMNYTTDSGEGLRPDVAMIDDPQDRDTSLSPTQIRQTIQMIDQDIAGMAGADSTMPMMMAATVKQVDDVADHYSKEWQCVRIAQITSWPADRKIWDEWNIIRRDGEHDKDEGKAALAYYKAHKAQMIEGMSVSWDHRYSPADGQPDAFFAAMHDYYQMGHNAFMSERQNEPINDMETGRPYAITPEIIQSRQNGYDRFIEPAWSVVNIAGTDLNPSYALSTAITAYGRDQTAAVLWYGLHPMDVSGDTTKAAREAKVYEALVAHGKHLASLQCAPGLWIIDAGGTDFDVVLQFVRNSVKLCGIQAIGAVGKSSKMYKPWGKNIVGQPRDQCHMRADSFAGVKRTWLNWNADYWKEAAQRAWLGSVGAPGSCSIYNGNHGEFSEQICREILMGKADVGGTMIWNYHTQPGKHDFGDCMAMCYTGSAWQGIGTGGGMVHEQKQKAKVFIYRPSQSRR